MGTGHHILIIDQKTGTIADHRLAPVIPLIGQIHLEYALLGIIDRRIRSRCFR